MTVVTNSTMLPNTTRRCRPLKGLPSWSQRPGAQVFTKVSGRAWLDGYANSRTSSTRVSVSASRTRPATPAHRQTTKYATKSKMVCRILSDGKGQVAPVRSRFRPSNYGDSLTTAELSRTDCLGSAPCNTPVQQQAGVARNRDSFAYRHQSAGSSDSGSDLTLD